MPERDVEKDLRGRSWDNFDAAIRAALAAPEADELLAQALRDVQTRDRRVMLAAALGETSGPLGDAVLDEVLRGDERSQDLRCAALLAVAKRGGEGVTDTMVDALQQRDHVVKDYAVLGLAGAGDPEHDGAWDAVLRRLAQVARRSSRSRPSEVLVAAAFLGQTENEAKLAAAVQRIRDLWRSLTDEEQAWFREFWPEVANAEVASTRRVEPLRLRAWVRNPLFDAPVFE